MEIQPTNNNLEFYTQLMFYSGVREHKQPGLETWPKKNELFSFPAEFRENTVVSGQSFQAGENSQTKRAWGQR